MTQFEKAGQTLKRLPRCLASHKLLALPFLFAAIILAFGRCRDEKTITGPVAARNDASVAQNASLEDRQEFHSTVKPHRTPQPSGTPQATQTQSPPDTPTSTPTAKARHTPKATET